MAKVGILVECGRDGLEIHMCRRICALLREDLRIQLEEDIVPMGNKKLLLEECANAARLLFTSGCDRVVILWDERPPWPVCWHTERGQILAALRGAGLRNRPAFPVCIEREFESWLLFDERMLSCVLSTVAHPVKVPRQKNPHRVKNPKSRMITLFRKHGKRYVDVEYARRLAACLEDLSHLRKCETFCRFAEKITGRML